MSFHFPDTSTGFYVTDLATTQRGLRLQGTVTATFTITTTGAPVFNWMSEPFNTCTQTPANVHLEFGSSTFDVDGEHWWSNPANVVLAQPGTFTITTTTDPSNWSGVFGEQANQDATTLAAFNAALRSIAEVGLSFGGGCFFGHGVAVSGGTATFELLSFQ